MGAPKQVNKLSQQFESPAFEGVTRAQTGNARLLHVNLVISWLRDLADSESYADNAKAKEAGLKKGDLYITKTTDGMSGVTTAVLKIVIDQTQKTLARVKPCFRNQ